MMAKLQQQSQAIQTLMQQLAQMADELKTQRLKYESAERVATQGNQTKILVAEAMSKSASMNKLADLDHAALQAELDRRAALLRAGMDVEAAAAADAAEHLQLQQAAQQKQQAEAQSQANAQAHEQGMAAQQQGHEADMAQAATPPIPPPAQAQPLAGA
jgi:hypothetical protein